MARRRWRLRRAEALPARLRERLGTRPGLDDGYELITTTMQRTLSELAEHRTLPVIG